MAADKLTIMLYVIYVIHVCCVVLCYVHDITSITA